MVGKCLNAGQTCIAPDYVLLPEGREEAFIAAAKAAAGLLSCARPLAGLQHGDQRSSFRTPFRVSGRGPGKGRERDAAFSDVAADPGTR